MFKIYYTDPVTDWSHAKNAVTLPEALQYTEGFRKLGMVFVAMVAEDPTQVHKTGVDVVANGVDDPWHNTSGIG
jgi:hypothetical protein